MMAENSAKRWEENTGKRLVPTVCGSEDVDRRRKYGR